MKTLARCLLLLATFGLAASVLLENSEIRFSFDDAGSLTSLYDKKAAQELADTIKPHPLWSVKYVTEDGSKMMHSTAARRVDMRLEHSTGMKTLLIEYDCVPFSIQLRIDLGDDEHLARWHLSILTTIVSSTVGLWEAHVNVPVSIGTGESGELFFPSGLGQGFRNPFDSTGGSVEGDYPSGGCSMQFMALCDDYDDHHQSQSGLYVAALDPLGYLKQINYATTVHKAAFAGIERKGRALQKESWVAAEHVESTTSTSSSREHMLTIIAYPENAGLPLAKGSRWHIPYGIAVGVVRDVNKRQGRPLWFQAAQMYRNFALHDAKWTQKGPISSRKGPQVPEWYYSNSIWMNSHWQCHDVFNSTGGKPAFVNDYTKEISTLLNQPSTINHWYEWQQGPDPAPDARYLFDTHYPDYFPPRQGFREVVSDLQDQDIHIVPYINGRIFDIQSDSYLADDGEQYCTKDMGDTPRLITNDVKLQTIIETYGSNASFCVANPSMKYWQDKIVEAAVDLIGKYGSHGVYIDQIGAAKPYLCYDASMNHTLGGGLYWTNGYNDILSAIKTAQPSAPIITECNAEPYMDNLDGYLVLTTFKGSMSTAPSAYDPLHAAKSFNPAFNAVYGGYYTAMGAEWAIAEFNDHGWFRGKLAAMFSSGTQLGWFSLAGLDDKDGTDHCGPMGVGESLKDASNSDVVDYMRLLAAYRRAGVEYFAYGHIASPVVADPPVKVLEQNQGSSSEAKGGIQTYDSMSVSAWQSVSDQSTLVVLACNTEEGYKGKIRIDMQQWKYDQETVLQVTQLVTSADDFDSDGKQQVSRQGMGTVSGPQAWVDIDIEGVAVMMLELAVCE